MVDRDRPNASMASPQRQVDEFPVFSSTTHSWRHTPQRHVVAEVPSPRHEIPTRVIRSTFPHSGHLARWGVLGPALRISVNFGLQA
jgi:hypothetical protein